jgi:hypothetical protein
MFITLYDAGIGSVETARIRVTSTIPGTTAPYEHADDAGVESDVPGADAPLHRGHLGSEPTP